MKVFLFSSDVKGFTYLKSTFKELRSKNHEAFFLYGTTNHVISHPPSNLDKFSFDSTSEVDFSKGVFIESIGLNLPYIPDYLILTRDRWMPEQYIIHEFKQKYPQTKICYVELNTNICQAIELKMELISRTKPPQNQIDIIFDHSSFCQNNKKTSLKWDGWDRGVVVGNPCWDSYNLNHTDVNRCIEKYNIDTSKTQLLFFGTVNGFRYKVFEYLKLLTQKLDRSLYQIYFKPYPGEPNHPLFAKDYTPDFFIKGLDGIIHDQEDLLPMSNICDYHIINALSSVSYGGILFNKQLVTIDNFLDTNELYNDLEAYLKDDNVGAENYNSSFWMRVHNLSTQQDFIDLIGLDNLEKFISSNNEWKSITQQHCHMFDLDLNFLNNPHKDPSNLKVYFDEFGDGEASTRIVKYLENTLPPQ